MSRITRLLGAAGLGVATMAALAASIATEYGSVRHTPAAQAEPAQNGRVIVKYRERSTTLSASNGGSNAGPQAAASLGRRLGVALTDGRILGTRTQVLQAASLSSSELAAALATDADVESVDVDRRAYIQSTNAVPPDDPLYEGGQATTTPVVGQWYLRAPDSTVKSSINIEPAWAITTGSSSIVVADVDTGITTHPDLTGKILTGYDFISSTSTANDGDGRDSDPSDPGDWTTTTDCTDSSTATDSSWHGTETAGILGAATNNGVGMSGVGYNIKVVPARALGKCGGYTSDIIAAAEWAGGVLGPTSGYAVVDASLPVNANPARVVNLSLGGDGDCSTAYRDALTLLRNHGVIAVAAAGNGVKAGNEYVGSVLSEPADCRPAANDVDQTPIVISVAALRHTGTKVGFSNLGPQVTISAPGGNCVNTSTTDACLYPILTTSNTGTTSPGSPTYTTSFGDYSLGTSFSTPMVASTVALMLSAAPNLTNAQVINLLKSSATAFPTTGGTAGITACVDPATTPHQGECICTTATCGAGMLNAGAAVTAAAAVARLAAPVATITDSASTVAAGSAVTLNAASSTASTGATISSYAWAITSGGAYATLGATSGSSVTLTGVASGTVTVRLTVTDSIGATATSTTTVAVTAAATSSGSSSGGGGGGATHPAWLLALALAGALLAPRKRRATR